ncbi:Covalently-linked cell wall protein 14 precursor, putative, partial [Perkinsus marinus ATCC 50983]
AFTPSNASWWNSINSAPSSSDMASESSIAVPASSRITGANPITSLPVWGDAVANTGDNIETATLASVIANLSSSSSSSLSPSSISSTPHHRSTTGDLNTTTEASDIGLAQHQNAVGGRSPQETGVGKAYD